MGKHSIIGIDLAGSPRRPTGACLLRGLVASTTVLFEDDKIVRFVREASPELVTVDAPLHLPPGRSSIEDRNGEHYRPCDLELRKLGIPFFPITLGPMRMLTVRGITLKKKMEREGFRVVEMYPGAAQDIWRIPRARQDLKKLRRGLERFGINGLTTDASADELDAATGALVGRLFLQGKACVLGDFETGAILIPALGAPGGRRAKTMLAEGRAKRT